MALYACTVVAVVCIGGRGRSIAVVAYPRNFPDAINSDVGEKALFWCGEGGDEKNKRRKKHSENIKLLQHNSKRPSSPSGEHRHAHNNTAHSRISVETNDDERVPNGPKAFTIVLIRMCEHFFRTHTYIYTFFFSAYSPRPLPPHNNAFSVRRRQSLPRQQLYNAPISLLTCETLERTAAPLSRRYISPATAPHART